jgi:hypothetical protein
MITTPTDELALRRAQRDAAKPPIDRSDVSKLVDRLNIADNLLDRILRRKGLPVAGAKRTAAQHLERLHSIVAELGELDDLDEIGPE